MNRKIRWLGVIALLTILLWMPIQVGANPDLEDFTAYTEVDPNDHINVVNSTHIQVTDIAEDEDAYLYRDYGAGFFANFTHYLEVRLDDHISATARANCWAVANEIDDWTGVSDGFSVQVAWANAAGTWRLKLAKMEAGTETSASADVSGGTWYYLTITRNGDTLTLDIYSDANRSTLVDSLSLTVDASISFRYLYAVQSQNSGDADTLSFTVANLDIGLNSPQFIGFEAPSKAYAHKWFYLNASINDDDGASDIKNCSLTLNGGITLKWDGSNFTLTDSNGYAELDASGCLKTVLNSTAVKLSWKVKLDWDYPYESVDVDGAVYDAHGKQDTLSVSDLFDFEDDLKVLNVSVSDDRASVESVVYVTGEVKLEDGILPDDWSGAVVKVGGHSAQPQSDGSFNVSLTLPSEVGLHNYTVYSYTVDDGETSILNGSISVIADRIVIPGFHIWMPWVYEAKYEALTGQVIDVNCEPYLEYDHHPLSGNDTLQINGYNFTYDGFLGVWVAHISSSTPDTVKLDTVSSAYEADYGIDVGVILKPLTIKFETEASVMRPMNTLLTQYLMKGDLVGFVTGCYTMRLGEVFYGLVLLALMIPIYIRYQSLMAVAVLMLLLGAVIEYMIPTPAITMSKILIILGVAGILYRLFVRRD